MARLPLIWGDRLFPRHKELPKAKAKGPWSWSRSVPLTQGETQAQRWDTQHGGPRVCSMWGWEHPGVTQTLGQTRMLPTALLLPCEGLNLLEGCPGLRTRSQTREGWLKAPETQLGPGWIPEGAPAQWPRSAPQALLPSHPGWSPAQSHRPDMRLSQRELGPLAPRVAMSASTNVPVTGSWDGSWLAQC